MSEREYSKPYMAPVAAGNYALKEPASAHKRYGYPDDFGPEFGAEVPINAISENLRQILSLPVLNRERVNDIVVTFRDALTTDLPIARIVHKIVEETGIAPVDHVYIHNGAPAQSNSAILGRGREIIISRKALELLDEAEYTDLDAAVRKYNDEARDAHPSLQDRIAAANEATELLSEGNARS